MSFLAKTDYLSEISGQVEWSLNDKENIHK